MYCIHVLYVFLSLLSLAPCAAENVAADIDCHNNTVKVSWNSAKGANLYMVTAVGADGHKASCESDGDQCDLMELQCGQMYNISLTAISDHCQTATQADVTFSARKSHPRTAVLGKLLWKGNKLFITDYSS